MQDKKILVWLASPMGDAILCTPALRAIRQHFQSAQICFFAKPVIRQILSPGSFNDTWLEQQNENPFVIAKLFKKYNFTHAVLFKNSFASGLTTFLARIPSRTGYAREGRSLLLTDKLYPPRLSSGKFKPISMIDYYLAIASRLGADTTNRTLELLIDPHEEKKLKACLPQVANSKEPIVILVPGGAFGPSKCWPSDRFAQTADRLIKNYNATVIVSVSPNPAEKKIAREICDFSNNKLINLGENPVNLGQLKSLFSIADLVISNDTGPRHIAIALGRKIVTLFGPNNPQWTETGYENEIKIIGNVPCVPCDKPICKQSEHLCMEAITTEMVCDAARKLLENNHKSKQKQEFIEISKSFFVDTDFKDAFDKLGLTSIDNIFSCNSAKNLTKKNLAKYRSRLQLEIGSPSTTVFLKRYNSPPIWVQLKNRLCHHKKISCGLADYESAGNLALAGINTPKTISYGEQWGKFFEKRSFIITEKIPNAESLERKLPNCFTASSTIENLKLRRIFIKKLAGFAKKFHGTGYRHRDLYLCHIFYNDSGEFFLIDLSRAFKPKLLSERFRIKDIAQLYYSAPGSVFSGTDRIRFYMEYCSRDKLNTGDKIFIRKVVNRAKRMASHDTKHGRTIPFAS
jgi:heptosyltransferase II